MLDAVYRGTRFLEVVFAHCHPRKVIEHELEPKPNGTFSVSFDAEQPSAATH